MTNLTNKYMWYIHVIYFFLYYIGVSGGQVQFMFYSLGSVRVFQSVRRRGKKKSNDLQELVEGVFLT